MQHGGYGGQHGPKLSYTDSKRIDATHVSDCVVKSVQEDLICSIDAARKFWALNRVTKDRCKLRQGVRMG